MFVLNVSNGIDGVIHDSLVCLRRPTILNGNQRHGGRMSQNSSLPRQSTFSSPSRSSRTSPYQPAR